MGRLDVCLIGCVSPQSRIYRLHGGAWGNVDEEATSHNDESYGSRSWRRGTLITIFVHTPGSMQESYIT